jgi:hypothetical protein
VRSVTHLTGACPVKFTIVRSAADLTGAVQQFLFLLVKDVAKALNVSRASVSKAMSRGEKLVDKKKSLWGLLKQS